MVTNLQFVISKMNGSSDENATAISIEIEGLNPSAEYLELNKCKLYGIAIKGIISKNNGIKSVAEGSYRVEYDKANSQEYIRMIANESGCRDIINEFGSYGLGVVQNKSKLW